MVLARNFRVTVQQQKETYPELSPLAFDLAAGFADVHTPHGDCLILI